MTPIQAAIHKVGPAKVASLIGVSLQAVCFYRDGKRNFPVEHGAALEAASGTKRWDMWPQDWHRIWPELVGSPGAPEVQKAA